jgi:hypothetical protein
LDRNRIVEALDNHHLVSCGQPASIIIISSGTGGGCVVFPVRIASRLTTMNGRLNSGNRAKFFSASNCLRSLFLLESEVGAYPAKPVSPFHWQKKAFPKNATLTNPSRGDHSRQSPTKITINGSETIITTRFSSARITSSLPCSSFKSPYPMPTSLPLSRNRGSER